MRPTVLEAEQAYASWKPLTELGSAQQKLVPHNTALKSG